MPVESQQALDAVVLERYHRRQQQMLKPLVTQQLIDEQCADPLGQTDDARRRILNYFGNLPVNGKLITEHDGHERWYVCRLVGSPPIRAERVAGPLETQKEALAFVFRQRLSEVFELELSAGRGAES